MMHKIYSSPIRVYLILTFLALMGIYCGFNLPVSLFPNSTKPEVWVHIGYGNNTAESFLYTYGNQLESQLRQISTEEVVTEKIVADYHDSSVNYNIDFKWGASPQAAKREVQTVINSFAARFTTEVRDSIWVWNNSRNSGFFAASFYSQEKSPNEIYEIIEPILLPLLSKVKDADNPSLYNPSQKEVLIELIPEAIAALQIFPKDIEQTIRQALQSNLGGSLPNAGGSAVNIEMPRKLQKIQDVLDLEILTPKNKWVHLSDVAKVEYKVSSSQSRVFKTSGATSLILWSKPKPGGNIKQMSEDMISIVNSAMPQFPKDIQYKVLVDPSEFIRSSIKNVFHEVLIAASLAVFILFLFIGSLKNVITAAIEIPLSMVLAFILMKFFDMNINLISLGGLALSAGMNVDASVVVMENIFRHFEMNPLVKTFEDRLKLIVAAVNEVKFAVIASTIASLVVFIPLTFTSDLSYAILGDLAKAVVFSHGFSAIVALILVPTVRLQLLQLETKSEIKSPIEKYLNKMEVGYGELLGKFLSSRKIRLLSYGIIILVLIGSIGIIYPSLRKEVIGKPDTDWVILSINTEGNTLTRQMESRTEEIEKDILKTFAPFIQYTFTQIDSANSSEIMLRLKDKSQMKVFWKQLEEKYKNQPLEHYWVGPWNPSELPIPDPDHLKIEVKGGTSEEQQLAAAQIETILNEKKVFPKIFTSPSINRGKFLSIEPYNSQWLELRKNGFLLMPSDLIEMVRVATQGKKVDEMPILERATSIQLKYPDRYLEFPEEVSSLPIGTGQKIIPLRALAKTELKSVPPSIRKEQQKRLFVVSARENNGEEAKAPKSLEVAKKLVEDFKKLNPNMKPTVSFEDPAPEITQAMQQLTVAVVFSILIIFIVLVFQFGTFIEPLLVMVSIPLGFIGVFLSLFIFQSSLSLNSILGIILLNGISVANSILLVDFIKRLKEQGLPPRAAAITAAQKRLRPILITSLTTVLGMLPMAMGFGEGGKILQPLGIAVSGGLWMSMLLTLFLVPALHVSYLNWNKKSINFKRLFFKTATASLFFFSANVYAAIPFEEALETILNRNPQLDIQKNTVEKEMAASLPSKLFYLPTVSIEGGTQMNSLVSSAVPTNSISANLKWNLFKFGADYQANSAFNLSIEAENESYKQILMEVEYLSVKTISEVIQSYYQNKISEKFFEFQKKASQIAEARYQAGRLPLQELEKLRIDNNNAKASFQDTKIELTKNEAVLLELLGNTDIEKKWFWKDVLIKPIKIFSKNISEQPGLLAAKKKWESAQKRTSSSFRKILPSLDLAAFYGYQVGSAYTGTSYGGGLTLTLPLFDKLAQYSDYRVNYHSEKSLEASYTQYKRKLEAEWEALKQNFEKTLETTLSREENLLIAKKLYTNAEDRFRKGLTSANELTVDQTRLYNAELFALKGWANLHILFAESCKTVGLTLKECLKY